MSFALLKLFVLVVLPMLAVGYSLYRKALRPTWIKATTAINELEDVGKPREGSKLKGTVVIAGGSITGLNAARVCTDHFDKVIVIDPEAWLATEEGITPPERHSKEAGGQDSYLVPINRRSRVPQSYSVHWYQVYSTRFMRKLFSSTFDKEVKDAGVTMGPANYNFSSMNVPIPAPWDDYNGMLPEGVYASRPTYEAVMRKLVRECGRNIEFVVGSVSNINPSASDRSLVNSVTVKFADDSEITYDCSLFIDCAGPTHLGLKWLRDAGYGNPLEGQTLQEGQKGLSDLLVKYDPKMGYSTSEWPITEDIRDKLPVPGGWDRVNWIYQYTPVAKFDNKSLITGKVDGDFIQISCGGWGPDVNLPKNPQEILDHIDSMNGYRDFPEWFRPMLEQLFKNKDQATYKLFRVPPCSWVKYEDAVNIPSNYCAVGDATMRVNPVFSQGVTKAFIGIAILDAALREVKGDSLPAGWSQKFFKAHAARTVPVFQSVKTLDYGWKSTVPLPGETLEVGAFKRWYNQHLSLAASWDKRVASTFWHTRMFLAPGSDLFEPYIVLRVLQQYLTNKALAPSWEQLFNSAASRVASSLPAISVSPAASNTFKKLVSTRKL